MKKNRRPISLKLRVLLFVFAATVISLPVNTSLIFSSIEHHFLEQDADELRVITYAIEEIIHQSHRSGEIGKIKEALSLAVSGHHGVYYQVENTKGTLLYLSEAANFENASQLLKPVEKISSDQLETWKNNGKYYNGVLTMMTKGPENYFISAAIDTSFHHQFLKKLERSLWLIMFGTGIVTLIATWIGIYHGLFPLRGVSRSIRDIQTNRLDTAFPLKLYQKK